MSSTAAVLDHVSALISANSPAVLDFAKAFPLHSVFFVVTAVFVVVASSEIMRPTTWEIKGLKGLKRSNKFTPKKALTIKDSLFIAFLNEELDKGKRPCYVITDPDQEDNPIVFASEGFCNFTGYSKSEVEGRNCRFLQGQGTKAEHKSEIRAAVEASKEVSVQLLNYKKNGESFVNQFFLTPLHCHDKKKVAYFLGVQKEVAADNGNAGENAGWRLFMWL